MKTFLFFATLIANMLLIHGSASADFKTSSQVVKEMKQSGLIPQGLKPKMYHPLDEVISKESRSKLHKRRQQAAPSAVPSDIDLREFDSAIRSQWDGTCTAHGLIAGMENILNRTDKKNLSVRYFWNQYRQYSAEAAIRAANRNKQIEEKYWPQNSVRPVAADLVGKANVKLNGSAYLEDDISRVIDALATKAPVYVAMSVPADMASCRSSIRYKTRMVNGGHALAVVGYHLDQAVPGGGYLILKNSWGTDCGDQGYQYLPMGLCQRSDMYCMFWSLS